MKYIVFITLFLVGAFALDKEIEEVKKVESKIKDYYVDKLKVGVVPSDMALLEEYSKIYNERLDNIYNLINEIKRLKKEKELLLQHKVSVR